MNDGYTEKMDYSFSSIYTTNENIGGGMLSKWKSFVLTGLAIFNEQITNNAM